MDWQDSRCQPLEVTIHEVNHFALTNPAASWSDTLRMTPKAVCWKKIGREVGSRSLASVEFRPAGNGSGSIADTELVVNRAKVLADGSRADKERFADPRVG